MSVCLLVCFVEGFLGSLSERLWNLSMRCDVPKPCCKLIRGVVLLQSAGCDFHRCPYYGPCPMAVGHDSKTL